MKSRSLSNWARAGSLIALCAGTAAPAQEVVNGASDAAASVSEVDAAVVSATERLRSYLDNTTTLRAHFRGVVLDEDRTALAQSEGELALKRPGRFRWEETAPEAELLVTDGISLWNYTPDLEQVSVRDVASLDRSTPAHLLGGGADLEKDFRVVGGYRVGELDWVDVRPRADSSDFSIVRFGFSSDGLRMMELHSKIGNITQYVLDDVEENGRIADSVFTFVPPPGTDVVDGS
ncbi:MAG: outer membrane lipoprotein chaperone LolA [Pseudomonadota bacterium]